jgi:hypothetical protein
MDWLSKYGENINCHKKEVTFRLQGIEEFKFSESRVRATLSLLFAVQAIKSVRVGVQSYLAYVQAKPKVKAKLEKNLVVCNYPDVFAEVTRLPPDRKIEFTTNLVQGT